MKTTTKVTEITHEDLVNIICTATYGTWIGCGYSNDEYNKLDESQKHGDCIEDKCADLLLAGKSIYFYDYYAENETDYYGDLPYEYDEQECRMCYTVTLQDIIKGVEKCFDGSRWERQCANELLSGIDGNFDLNNADTIAQIILFGEEVYS